MSAELSKRIALSFVLAASGLGWAGLEANAFTEPKDKGSSAGPEKPAAVAPALGEEWAAAFQWRSIGPANMSGRITALSVYEADSNIFWAASASGGLLKTENKGVTFEHQFDHEHTVSIGAVAVCQSDPKLVWVGTGEANPRNSVSYGDGVYKSVDGGKTWKHMGLKQSFQIGRIAIHPDNPEIVYVAALGRLWGSNEERGLFRTRDGGENWEKVLYVDERTGAVDVVLKPGAPDSLLVATYERERDLFDTNDPKKKWGPGSGLYRSTDGGDTFQQVTEGLPKADLGRISLEYYRQDPNIVYALVESSTIGEEPENAPYMGVRGEDADVGARLTEILDDGPSKEAGLKKGDIVISLADKTVQSYDDLVAKIREHLAGETVKVEVSRERKSVVIDLTFTKRPGTEEDQGQKPHPEELTEEPGPPEQSEAKPEETAEETAEETVEETAEETVEESTEETTEASPEETPEAQPEETPAEKDAEQEPKEPKPRTPFRTSLGGQVANVQGQQGPDGHEYGGLYRSADGGQTWTRINSLNPRPMYFSRLRVDPSDEQHIYVLGISLHRSKDGGETFTDDGGRGGVHVDHHALWVDPNDGRHIMLGNDGGLYVTYDRMEHWDHFNHAAIGQFYHVAVGPRRDYRVYGGLQDNGTWGGPNRGPRGGSVNEDWISIGGGDGFICQVDPEDADLVYFESQNGGMGRYNLRTGERGYLRAKPPRGVKYRFNWRTPFLLSSHNSSIFYAAGNYVLRSLYRGDDLKQISPEITNTDKGSATALAESPLDSDVLYVGSDDGALFATRDGGVNWVDLFGQSADSEEEPALDPGLQTASAGSNGDGESGNGHGENGDGSTPVDDPISGIWKAKTVGQSRRRMGGGEYTVQLTLGQGGKLTGTFESAMGEGEVSDGQFNAETRELVFSYDADMFRLDFRSKLQDDGKLKGTMDVGGGRFSSEFEATRTKVGAATEEEVDPFDWKGIAELVQKPMRVSSLETSRFEKGRVYMTLDGHYADDDRPQAFVSEDFGQTWRSLTGQLPEGCGTTRVVREDLENADLLYLGTEFGAYVSIDRGATWTSLNTNLPTVAVHEFAQHATAGEIVVATHGRSLWALDVTALRQINQQAVAADFKLYKPNSVVYFKPKPRKGGTLRRFRGENPKAGATIFYSFSGDQDRVGLEIRNSLGETIKKFEPKRAAGLHSVSWDLRRSGSSGRFRRGPRIAPGTYQVVLTVANRNVSRPLSVLADPDQPELMLWGVEYDQMLEQIRLFGAGEEDHALREGGDEPH